VAECADWERGPKEDIRIIGLGIIAAKNKCWHPKNEKDCWKANPPDFLDDLNAIHRALIKARFTQWQWSRYCDLLLEIAGENLGGAFEATAEQRSEAFVLTLEGEL
jgi:hypothetical protein